MVLLDKAGIIGIANEFVDASEHNRVSGSLALRPDLADMRIFEQPLIGLAAADDPVFEELRRPGVIGPHFRLPGEWLPGAKGVVSFFLPFAEHVVESNRPGRDPLHPSPEWLHGRVEGQAMVNRLGERLVRALEDMGRRAVQPSASDRFRSWINAPSGDGLADVPFPAFTSNWSERHVAYACGLGTFGLCAGLITERGIAGRFGSVVTDMPVVPDPRPYTRHDEYCTRCGACAGNCFAGAVTPERGKDHSVCSALLDIRKVEHKPRYGCGKCNVGVPCERKRP